MSNNNGDGEKEKKTRKRKKARALVERERYERPGLVRDRTGLGNDFPAEHHRVVLMGQVVAVRHVLAREGAEVAVEDDGLARVHRDDVVLAGVVGVAYV